MSISVIFLNYDLVACLHHRQFALSSRRKHLQQAPHGPLSFDELYKVEVSFKTQLRFFDNNLLSTVPFEAALSQCFDHWR